MNNSLKIGIVAGLVAGIIAGIVAVIVHFYLYPSLSLTHLFLIPEVSFSKIVTSDMIISIIWGAILGIIYSRIYDLIPRKKILKSLVYGLGIFLIMHIRFMTFDVMVGQIPSAIDQFAYIFSFIAFGLVLGVIFEFLHSKQSMIKEELKIIRRDIKGGIHPGAFAGFAGGTAVFVCNFIIYNKELWPKYSNDVVFLLGQFGTHALFNMIWGAIFGILFVMFYEKIPRAGILKAIIYGMIIFLLTTFRGASYYLILVGPVSATSWLYVGGFFQFLVFGFVLGLLYKKPSETPSMKKEDIQMVKMVNCIHCNAAITKGSKYCNECGKKQ